MASIRRLLADLRRPETRGDALRRVRKRAASELRRTAGTVPKAPAGSQRPDSWYVGEWSRLAKAVLGPDAAADAPTLDSAIAPEAIKEARRQRSQAALAEAIAQGEPLERAVCRSVAALTDTQEWNPAWAMAEGVGRMPGGAVASAMGHAVLLHRRRQFDRVWKVVCDLDDDALASFIAVEAVDAALAAGTAEARQRALAIAVPTERMDASVVVDLAGRFLAVGERERAAALVTELHRRSSVDLDERRRYSLTLIEGWLGRRPPSMPAGSVPVALMDYRTPDHVQTSGNVGDYIQTLAFMGNLVRLSNLTFSGDDGLGELAAELQARVQPELRVPDVSGSMHLIAVDRDFSTAGDLPDGTWMVAFGWHMHALYDLRYDFPYHPSIRPVFISFHISRLEMLSDAALSYLRQHGPVGCRDWNTVFLLLSAGVDAFFTGCLTTTVDALFPARETVYQGKGAVGVIDLPPRSAGRDATHVRAYSYESDHVGAASLADGLRAADSTLAAYQQDLDRAITGHLRTYLSLTSLGIPVEFRTRTPGHERFAGLTGLHPGDAGLTEMRDGIRELIGLLLERVMAGAAEAEVYALWRDLTRERVAEARARFEAPVSDTRTAMDLATAIAAIRAGSRRFEGHETVDREAVTDIVLSYDQNLTTPAAVLVESIVANASGPLRLWVLGRSLPDAYPAWLATAFPSVTMTFLPCDQVAYGPSGRPRRVTSRITISTMDRLILPDLLDDVDRVVYLDVDTLVLEDICLLARIDLGGQPLAARDSNVSEASEWVRAGRGLDEELAVELRRRMARRHGVRHPALNAGVLVLDLDRMRRDDFTATYLGMVERYGFHDQDTLLAYVGPDRAVVDPRWNAMPVLEDVPDPSLIHWASFGKPWDRPLTHEQDRWRAYAERLHARAGDPPTDGLSAGVVRGR